ncbi:CPBP family intramembrane metalloprotease [Metabacillus litoralis]|uniref:CPBP family intramembrane glutamic endopeptidase n=1 Tax=Metabacillus TaxID=2675233 RepID=UPI000EF56364|nr:type II CAAX endopeptidase family protein [Metabacillus litoralis]MCM3408892.1 CPBP family intramembrane metalloprotease [Metabacillus litoralis]UHA59462.1 CPBP family intramembrane metalloprotease [Metabacillus litoralis]
MRQSFIKIEEGKNTHKRYIGSLFVILAFMLILGTVAYTVALILGELVQPGLIDFETGLVTDPLVDLYLLHLQSIFLILGLLIAVKAILKRRFISLITPYKNLNWGKVFYGYVVLFILLVVFTLIDYAFFPNDYYLNDFDANRFMWLLVAVIFLVPIQTTSEELLFRGFLLQWGAKFTTNPILLAIIVGGIFGSLHFFNPEMEYGAFWVALDYLAMGFIWTYISIKTNSSEFSIGAHAANNMFLCLFLTMDDTVYGDIPSVFVTTNVNAMLSTLTTIITGVLFTIIVFQKQKKEMK